MLKNTSAILVLILAFAFSAFAQTSAFVYQGKLQDNGAAANGTYQFEFKLYDAVSGGSQVGQTISNLPATVTNGIFAVNLDFGTPSFNGEARFLEIAVRLNGSGQAYTTLNPRQALTSTPYAVKSLNADNAVTSNNSLNLGGIAANQYVITTDSRMSDARNPLAGSPNYIQNTTSQQTNSNFYISGEGRATTMTGVVVNATSEFRQGGGRVMQFNAVKSGFVGSFAGTFTTGAANMFVGFEAGQKTTTGSYNSFLGSESGKENLNGFNNSFFGALSGRGNTTGANNAFFGANSGTTNNGSFNSFFGSNSGYSNTSGANNSFFGASAGLNNAGGENNSFFGRSAGEFVTEGSFNSFFGAYTGWKTVAPGNTFIGANAGEKTTVGFSNTFVGLRAGQNNMSGARNVFLGLEAGKALTSGTDNIFIGTEAGKNTTNGVGNIAIGKNSSITTSGSSKNIVIGNDSFVQGNNSIMIGSNYGISEDNRTIIGNLATVSTQIFGSLEVQQLPLPNQNFNRYEVCWELQTGTLVKCYQGNFIEKSSGAVELTKRLDEQSERIKKQDEQIKAQQAQIDALKTLVCQTNPNAAVCQPK